MKPDALDFPKVCHLFWDGFPMSVYHVFTVISFHKQNPQWEIIVWLSKQKYHQLGQNTFVGQYHGQDHFELLRGLPYVQIKEVDLEEWGINTGIPSCSSSDIFRMLVLYKFGGVYSDFDVLWIKPISYLLYVSHIGFYSPATACVCFHEYLKGFQNVSIMVAKPNSTYLADIIDLQKSVKPPYEHQSYGSALISQRYPDLGTVLSEGHKVVALKYETFYPYSVYSLDKLFQHTDLSCLGPAIGVHWFCGHKDTLAFLNSPIQKGNSFLRIIQTLVNNV